MVSDQHRTTTGAFVRRLSNLDPNSRRGSLGSTAGIAREIVTSPPEGGPGGHINGKSFYAITTPITGFVAVGEASNQRLKARTSGSRESDDPSESTILPADDLSVCQLKIFPDTERNTYYSK